MPITRAAHGMTWPPAGGVGATAPPQPGARPPPGGVSWGGPGPPRGRGAGPGVVGFRGGRHSISTHASPAAAAAVCVVANARAADDPATGCSTATALPALKPNHPNHRRPAPVSVMGRLWG